ncbi:hypothetical protein DFH06DRAFT_1335680 [Mycena polygramma]|nr:hypothetical protein DFH06DRAFT_1335680 [Mycena polygramma]
MASVSSSVFDDRARVRAKAREILHLRRWHQAHDSGQQQHQRFRTRHEKLLKELDLLMGHDEERAVHDDDGHTQPRDALSAEDAARFIEEMSTIPNEPNRFIDHPHRIREAGREARPVIFYKPTRMENGRGNGQPRVWSSARTRVRYSTPGSRAVLPEPLTREALWLTADRPPAVIPKDPKHACGICHNLKSHPVMCQCGCSFCYVCIRLSLEQTWHCPDEFCGLTMRFPPTVDRDEETKIAAAERAVIDQSRVDYRWDGLVFPKRLPGVRYVV